MIRTFHATIDGEQAQLTLMSLSDYEGCGGVYSDAGNGGETVAASDFVGALYISDDAGYGAADVLAAAGVDGAWNDSTLVSTYLLTEWPTNAPYSARFVN
ncbi:MAG TPA: hypothetical protein VIO16_09175 [Dehalococcoidia bacterium]